jgi:site-specific DNA-methyltransferase (adenine-specific)
MREMPDKSVDLVLTDLPFGTTQNEWDKPIPLTPMWEQIYRIKKENTAIIFFGSGMFSAELMMSNKKLWRYNLIWEKGERVTGFLNAHKMPLRSHEDILIFYQSLPTYNPQFTRGVRTHNRGYSAEKVGNTYGMNYRTATDQSLGNQKFPKSILKFDKPHPPIHPSEKPVPLLEYLIRTYSNEGDTVLDFCIGSGSTAEAAVKSQRNYIGIEKEPAYVEIALKRLEKVNNHKITDFFGVSDA